MTYIGKPLFLKGTKKIHIGNKVRIFPGSRLETHEGGSIKIADNCSISQNVQITSAKEKLIIGKGTVIAANAFITNMSHDHSEVNKPILEQRNNYAHTEIGENCSIGFGAAIQSGTKLGKNCIVGANAIVKGNYPDYAIIAGTQSKIISKYNFQKKRWD